MNIKDKKILIVGLGLIGGSYARALTQGGYEIGAIDRRKETIDYALSERIISHGKTEPTSDYVSQFDIIVFALYPHVILQWIEENQHMIKSGAVLTDVTGVKCRVVYPIQKILREDLEFIGAHPMAGREVYGVENSRAELFVGANYIVTPTEKNTEKVVLLCEALGQELGVRRISRLSPEEHDEMIGFLSQLTHGIAVSLMNCKDSKNLVDYTGDSFRDLTRIAKINENMWSELFLMNRQELLSQMDLFSDNFKKLRDALAESDEEAMKKMMLLSTERRSYFDV